MKNKLSARYLLVLLAMCGMSGASVGLIINIAGLFFTPMSKSFNVSRASVALTLTIANLACALIGLIVPRLVKEKTLKQTIIAAAAVEVAGTMLLALAPNIIIMYLLNCIRGLAAGILGFVLVTVIINNWFKVNVALITSIALGFSGLVAAVFSPIISSIINAAGWRMAYFVVGIVMIIFNLPAIFFLPAIDPHTKNILAYGEDKIRVPHVTIEDNAPVKKISLLLVVMTCLYAVLICGASAAPQHFPGVAESYGLASIGALLISVGMIANTGGKLICGVLIDHIGTLKTVVLYLALIIIGTVMFLTLRTNVTMLIAALLFGMVYSMGSVGLVMMSKDLFGIENYSRTYPILNMFGVVSNALFSTLIGLFYDLSGGYTSTLILLLVMVVVGMIIVVTSYSIRAKQTAR